MSRLRRSLVAVLAASAISVSLTAPAQTANASGGPVTQVIVWGDSMTQVWPYYLETLLGVPVKLMGVGAENIQQTQARFNSWFEAADNQERASTGHLCWCGHVNFSIYNNNPGTIVPTLQAMASRVPTGLFMPIGLTNGPDQPAGSADYRRIVQNVNGPMARAFGSSYAEVRRYLVTDGLAVAGITPTTEDRQNIANDIPPRSLRTDIGNPSHLNDAGRRVTAQRLDDLIRAAGWVAVDDQGAASTTAVSSSANPSVYRSSIRVTARVSSASSTQPGTPSGTVQFAVDGRLFGTPVALRSGVVVSPPTRGLKVGTHTITAIYSGDATFAGSTAQFSQVVTA